jgi:Right handed beta helix region
VNSTRFAAGDKLLIKSGTSYQGRLWPKGSGRPGVAIVIDSYGEGARPAIHAGGETGEALLLEDTQGWHINNLELTNTGEKPEAFRFGLSITVQDMGTAGDFKLTNLYVHDVNGTTERGLGEGAGIIWRSRGTRVPTRFEGVLIEDCTVSDSGRNGIMSLSDSSGRTRRYADVGVVIRENDITSIPGDGIRLTGSDNAVVEYNRIQGAGGGEAGGISGGIVLVGCDNSLVQYNAVWETRGEKNAAMVCGTNSRDNTFQFNFTRDNVGPMVAVRRAEDERNVQGRGGGAGRAGEEAGNIGTRVRYNISQDDGGALRLWGAVSGARFYNNTVYTGVGRETVVVDVVGQPGAGGEDSAGPPTGTVVVNNLFYTRGVSVLDLGRLPEAQVHHNAYFGRYVRPEGEDGAVTGDPLLVGPGLGKAMGDGLEGYQTLLESPLRMSGVRLVGHGNYDFWGNSVPRGLAVDIGAYQGEADKAEQPPQTDEER